MLSVNWKHVCQDLHALQFWSKSDYPSRSYSIIVPGSHIEYPTGTKNSNFVEDHPSNIPAKFGSNRPSGFGEEAWNVKSLQTTDNGPGIDELNILQARLLDIPNLRPKSSKIRFNFNFTSTSIIWSVTSNWNLKV
jgi:hypothetical protein